uniref:Cytochrome c oxidase subunit 2 n=1 Tax=Triaenodes qinglingensis TaxID=2904906 RepID=A0A9E8LPE8_9NEOP|nr:cytochrome c oxidase subunit II [Triaenodes qinglingensis]UZZ44431.1 cytochrome c oxidase subunit II [Triaenodes qinglingensis]
MLNMWYPLMFLDSNSPVMEQLIFFHDHTLMILTLIVILIFYNMTVMLKNKFINKFLLQNHSLELMWTISPSITLIFIAFPSLKLLYMTDELKTPLITLKTVGHQWYWSYEYSDFKDIKFDSYMMNKPQLRLLDVDNRLILPMKTQIRNLITASDVIHSWTIPSLGLKTDATPGRMNQLNLYLSMPGLFYGQCSEICGMNHSFMPIMLESISMKMFIKWIKNY